MLSARITIDGDAARTVIPAMGPEAGRELPRTATRLAEDDGRTVIEIRAADTSAMRAALNSHLECIRVIQDIEDLTEMKP